MSFVQSGQLKRHLVTHEKKGQIAPIIRKQPPKPVNRAAPKPKKKPVQLARPEGNYEVRVKDC